MQVAQLFRYPVKSLGGQSMTVLQPAARGFVDDRRWMFIEASGRFISRRTQPQLAHFEARITGDTLEFMRIADGQIVGAVAGARQGVRRREVTVWDDTFAATLLEAPTVKTIAETLGIAGAQLVYMDVADNRPVDPAYAHPEESVSFADGFPYLITNTASLAQIAEQLGNPGLDVRRFRPNIVVAHDVPFAEDSWEKLEIGQHQFRLPKPCARCVMVTMHPDTGERTPRIMGELARQRRVGNKVLFGMNACWEGGTGLLRVGDVVTLLGQKGYEP